MGSSTFNFRDAYKRYNKLREEIQYNQRRMREEATEAVKAIAKISDADVALLGKEFPMLEIVRGYTVEQLIQNANGEREILNKLYADITDALEKYLKHFEDAIC